MSDSATTTSQRPLWKSVALGACAGAFPALFVGALESGWSGVVVTLGCAIVGAGIWGLAAAIDSARVSKAHAFTSQEPTKERADGGKCAGIENGTARASQRVLPTSGGSIFAGPTRLISLHWKGRLSLPVSFWVSGFVASFSGHLLGLTPRLIDITVYTRLQVTTWLIIWLYAKIAYVWWGVGAWRSAKIRNGRWLWPVAARVGVAYCLLSVSLVAIRYSLPDIIDYPRVMAGRSRYELEVSQDRSELKISGIFDFGLSRSVITMLEGPPDIKTLRLNSPGGRFREAEKLAQFVAKHHLDTVVAANCLSACVNVFAAGENRLISRSARIGLHAATGVGLDNFGVPSIDRDSAAFLIARGIDPAFVKRGLSTPSKQMWFPSDRELFESGLVTDYWKDENVEASE